MEGNNFMTVAFTDSAGMSIMEIGMAMLLMRTGSAELDDFAAEFARHFRVPVERDDIRPCYIGLLERGLIEPHPSETTRVLMTTTGEALTYAAFSGFIRLVDPSGQYFKASIIFGMTTRQHQEDDDD